MTSRRVTGDQGSVLVMVAFMLPVLLMFVSLVADVGNWFEHKRHLQLQADAAALAAAQNYPFGCTDSGILATARNYGGLGAYNAQIGGTPVTRVHLLLNSPTFWNQPSPTDPNFAGGANSSPCTSQITDVKMTENDVPWFFRVAQVPYINARARVEIRQLTQEAGALPLAVPDPNATDAAAIFVDNSTSAVIAKKRLTKRGTTTLNGKSLVRWDNVGDDAGVTVPSGGNVSVVIALSGASGGMSLTGTTLAAICDQPLVNCYGGPEAAWTGVLFIHGYDSTGGTPTNANPIVRDVQLISQGVTGGCADGSAPYFVLNTGCNVKAKVKIDFPAATLVNTITMNLTGLNCGAQGCPLTFQPTGADAGYWTTNANGPKRPSINVGDAGTAGLTAGITFKIGNGGGAVTGTITGVQRAYAASSDPDLSGPIDFATVFEDTGGGILTSNANSLTTNTNNPHNLVVEIGTLESLGNAQSVNDPIVVLRVTGSQNQSVDCDPNVPNLRDEIAQGCAPQYTINTGQVCPGTATSLWGTAQPWNCVAIQTGGSVGQVTQGFDARILQGGTCNQHPNNWANFPLLSASDTRITSLFLTPFGTFNGNGNTVVPVVNFATFYVTGWGRNGGGQSCPGDDKMPDGSNIPAGYVVGHFIKYVNTLNTGGGGPTPCDPNSFGSCVAVLTK